MPTGGGLFYQHLPVRLMRRRRDGHLTRFLRSTGEDEVEQHAGDAGEADSLELQRAEDDLHAADAEDDGQCHHRQIAGFEKVLPGPDLGVSPYLLTNALILVLVSR